jgi:predicted transcriptional regulator
MAFKKRLPVSSAELDVLRVLWDGGPATLRSVYERLVGQHAYTTVQTLLDRLVQKGMVQRDHKVRPALHHTKVSRSQILRHYVGMILNKICDGPAPVVMQLLRDQQFSAEEVAAIKKLVEQAERSSKGDRHGKP